MWAPLRRLWFWRARQGLQPFALDPGELALQAGELGLLGGAAVIAAGGEVGLLQPVVLEVVMVG